MRIVDTLHRGARLTEEEYGEALAFYLDEMRPLIMDQGKHAQFAWATLKEGDFKQALRDRHITWNAENDKYIISNE